MICLLPHAYGIFSFNPQGAITAARKCQEAGIPLVTVDNCGQALGSEYDTTAAIDFDWALWGKTTLTTWQSIIPARRLALITELLEHLPVQMINAAMKERMDELGKNQIVAMRDGKYDPPVAVNQVQDLVQFGLNLISDAANPYLR